MKFGLHQRQKVLAIVLTALLDAYSVGVSASLVASLDLWHVCDLGYTSVSPKVCVMQRNIGDYLRFRPLIHLGHGELLEFSRWFRMVRIFPGNKMFETRLTTESAGTYIFKDHFLDIPFLKEIDMDKNRLKYSVMGSYGSADEILFVIQQVPIAIHKYLGDPMLINLSHYTTIPEAAAHFDWTYHLNASQFETTLPLNAVQQRKTLKVDAITSSHKGLYICSFYGGQDDSMSFFLGQKVFDVIVLPRLRPHPAPARVKVSTDLEDPTRHNSSRPGWRVFGKKTLQTFGKPYIVSGRMKTLEGAHPESLLLKKRHDSKKAVGSLRRRKQRRKKLLRFEKPIDDDDDDDDDEEDEKSSTTTTTLPLPVTKPLHSLVAPQEAPKESAKDFVPMPPKKTQPILGTNTGGGVIGVLSSSSTFSLWMADYLHNIKKEMSVFPVRNGSVMDFEEKFPANAVRHVQSGGAVILQCPARMAVGTVDKSKVVWKKTNPLPSVLTVSADRYEILDSGDLKILRSVGEDSGEYGCEVDGKQTGRTVPLSVTLSILPRVFVTVAFTSSTCKAYLLEKVTTNFVSEMGPHVCPDEKCSMATPVMQCHMRSREAESAGSTASNDTAKSATDLPSLTLSFNFKLGANFKISSDDLTYKFIKQIYDRAVGYIQKHGQIYKPDMFDGKFVPRMNTMQMKTYGYCPPGFGIKQEYNKHSVYRCFTCAPGHYNSEEKPVCLACNYTQYQPKPAATGCDSCAGSSMVAQEGATSAETCEDQFIGMVKHNLIVASTVVLVTLLIAAGTFVFIKKRMGRKDVKTRIMGLEKEKKASESLKVDKPLAAAHDTTFMSAPVNATASTQQLQQQYPHGMVPMAHITASQMALHPSYVQLPYGQPQQPPTVTAAAPPAPSGQVSIILNNQIPQPIPPPPAPGSPGVQQQRATRPSEFPARHPSNHLLPKASYYLGSQAGMGPLPAYPAGVYGGQEIVPRVSYHRMPTGPVRVRSLQRAGSEQLRGGPVLLQRPIMPSPPQQAVWRRTSSGSLPR